MRGSRLAVGGLHDRASLCSFSAGTRGEGEGAEDSGDAEVVSENPHC